MYCPQCGVEYRDGITECPDCRVALVHSTRDLVVVLETNDRIRLAMAKGLLEDAGIPFFVQGQITTLIQDVDGFLRKWIGLQVPRDREAEAREVLAQFLQPVLLDDADSGA
jgi:hypothetical protein